MTKPDDDERMDDLAATSESLREDARNIAEIEEEKQHLRAGDPRLTSLSRRAERIAGEVQQQSRVERDLAESVDGNGKPEKRSN